MRPGRKEGAGADRDGRFVLARFCSARRRCFPPRPALAFFRAGNVGRGGGKSSGELFPEKPRDGAPRDHVQASRAVRFQVSSKDRWGENDFRSSEARQPFCLRVFVVDGRRGFVVGIHQAGNPKPPFSLVSKFRGTRRERRT